MEHINSVSLVWYFSSTNYVCKIYIEFTRQAFPTCFIFLCEQRGIVTLQFFNNLKSAGPILRNVLYSISKFKHSPS